MVTEFEQYVYNSYLSAIAKAADRPFRPRKNFDGFDDEKYALLKRLGPFLSSNDLDVEDFFNAPFFLYNDETYKPLSYYVTPDAVTSYTRFKRKQDECTDEEKLLDYTKKGLAFVLKFCIENNLTIDQYRQYKTDSDIPICLLHLKEHKINFFVVHALEIRSELYKLERGWREFYIKDFDNIFRDTFKVFTYSSTLKTKVKQITVIIERKLKRENE